MRFPLLVTALAADAVIASSWFGRTGNVKAGKNTIVDVGNSAYNKWHETELERWLSDNNVPYPTPADRRDLKTLVKNNWDEKVVTPYNSWDTNQMQRYINSRGQQIKQGTEKDKDSLIEQIKAYWTDTADSVVDSYSSAKNWVFDTWTESQLKAFADKHGIPVPRPRNRDTLLKTVRENYESAAIKLSQTTAYPANWIYESWSESDLKEWLDTRGIPVPQPNKRDQLIASVRRNSRIASNNLAAWSSSAACSAASATQSLSDALFEKYSDGDLKKWADEKGIKVPQGSKRNELLALVRKHNAQLNSEAARLSSSAASAYGAATSSAAYQYAQASQDAQYMFNNVQSAFYNCLDWAKSRFGPALTTISISGSCASSVASRSASSASSLASKSASSASSAASRSASSASKSASSAYSKGSKSASSASSNAKKEL